MINTYPAWQWKCEDLQTEMFKKKKCIYVCMFRVSFYGVVVHREKYWIAKFRNGQSRPVSRAIFTVYKYLWVLSELALMIFLFRL